MRGPSGAGFPDAEPRPDAAEGSTEAAANRLLGRRGLALFTALVVAVFFTIWLFWAASLAGVFDLETPPQLDFISFWTASRLALEGEPESAYNLDILHARQREDFGEDSQNFAWLYPPTFFFFLLPLAALPFGAAFMAWTVATGLFALTALRSMPALRSESSTRPQVLMLALLFPATLTNAFIGQNGFLTAALFAWGMVRLPSRPVASGLVLGLLAYKPQFFPLVVVALLAGRSFKALAASLTCAAVIAALSVGVFGPSVWMEFVSKALDSADYLYEGAFPLDRLQSVTSALLLLGAPTLLTQAAQAVAAALAAVFVVWLWRQGTSIENRAAGLALAMLLATPYSLHYDLTLLGLALLWLSVGMSRQDWRTWETGAIAFGWFTPLLSIVLAGMLNLTITPLVLVGLMGLVMRRVRSAPSRREPKAKADLPRALEASAI